MRLKPIETHYAGRYFRSRLEARWAVWFDAMRIPWEYEQVGFDVGGVWYLPDFFLPGIADGTHVEIKPGSVTRKEEARLVALQSAMRDAENGAALWVVKGYPGVGQHVVLTGDAEFVFAECRRCDGLGFEFVDGTGWGMIGRHTCGDNERHPLVDGARIVVAFGLAQRARFDHAGESASGGSR